MKLIYALMLCITLASAATTKKMEQCMIDKNCVTKGLPVIDKKNMTESDMKAMKAASVKAMEVAKCIMDDKAD